MTSSTRKWGIALALSVALNLFLLGAVSVHVMGRRAGAGGPHRGHPPGLEGPGPRGEEGPVLLRELVQVLGGPQDPRVQKLWSERRQDMKKFRDEMESSRRDVQSALSREPFDQAALEAALRHLQTTHAAGQQRSQDAILTLARQLSAAERKQLAERAPPPHEKRPAPGP